MIRKHHVRFGGGPGEKGCQQYLACGLPYMDRTQEIGEQLIEAVGREQALPLIVKALESATSIGDKQ